MLFHLQDSTGEGLAEDFKGKSWEEAGEKLANYMANNPDTSTNSLHKAAQVLSDDFEAAEVRYRCRGKGYGACNLLVLHACRLTFRRVSLFLCKSTC